MSAGLAAHLPSELKAGRAEGQRGGHELSSLPQCSCSTDALMYGIAVGWLPLVAYAEAWFWPGSHGWIALSSSAVLTGLGT